MTQYLVKHFPDTAPEGPLNGKGLLSPIGDPIGHVLNTALKPVGHIVGQVGHPSGQALLDVKEHVKDGFYEKEKKPEGEQPAGERMGNAQTAANPLGL